MGYSSTQFVGRKNALKAFQSMDVGYWSVLQGKQFLFKYEGGDKNEALNQLSELLDMIATSSGSEAVYTLQVYEVDEPAKGAKPKKVKIHPGTPIDGSFNFKIFDQDTERSPRGQSWHEVDDLKKEFSEMKLLLQQMIKQRNEEDAEYAKEKLSGIGAVFNNLLEMPEIKTAIAGKVVQLFNGVTSKIGDAFAAPAQTQLPAKIAGPSPEPIQMPQDKINMLNSALTTLASIDAQLPEHLFKLSQIAQNDPAQFQIILGLLNKM